MKEEVTPRLDRLRRSVRSTEFTSLNAEVESVHRAGVPVRLRAEAKAKCVKDQRRTRRRES